MFPPVIFVGGPARPDFIVSHEMKRGEREIWGNSRSIFGIAIKLERVEWSKDGRRGEWPGGKDILQLL